MLLAVSVSPSSADPPGARGSKGHVSTSYVTVKSMLLRHRSVLPGADSEFVRLAAWLPPEPTLQTSASKPSTHFIDANDTGEDEYRPIGAVIGGAHCKRKVSFLQDSQTDGPP